MSEEPPAPDEEASEERSPDDAAPGGEAGTSDEELVAEPTVVEPGGDGGEPLDGGVEPVADGEDGPVAEVEVGPAAGNEDESATDGELDGTTDRGAGDAPDGEATGEPDESASADSSGEGVPTDSSGDGIPAESSSESVPTDSSSDDVPADVRKYERFKKVDGAEYERVNRFLRDRTYVTAREWALARLCADFRTETGVEMTKIGENLPELVPFMTDTYTPQAVNQARSSFEEKVRMAGATFLYGAMCDFFTPEQLDEVMYEVTEVAKFLLEVEGVDLAVEEELEAEDRISSVMREVREASEALRYEECPSCGHDLRE